MCVCVCVCARARVCTYTYIYARIYIPASYMYMWNGALIHTCTINAHTWNGRTPNRYWICMDLYQ